MIVNEWSRALRRAVVVLLMGLGLLASGLGIAPAAQAETTKIATGWLPYWMTSPSRPAGVNSAVANADLLSEVSPFWYSAMQGGPAGVQIKVNPNFSNASANMAWSLAQLRGAGLRIVPAIADSTGKGKMAAVLADPTKRSAHVADLVNMVTSNSYDGVDLDYETFAFSDGSSSWAATQPNWTAFIQELGGALHAQGKTLSVTIPPPCTTANVCGPTKGYWVYNMIGIAPFVDHIRIMAYDFHVQGIGAIAPMPWVRAITSYAAASIPAEKVQIGVPTYGRSWTKRTASNGYQLVGNCPQSGTSAYRSLTSMASTTDADIPALLASVGVDPANVQWDPTAQESWVEYDKPVTWTDGAGATQTCTAKRIMWWVGPQGVLARTQLVGEFGLGGAAYWTIGGDDPAQWPLIRAYASQFAPVATAVTVTAAPVVTFASPLQVSAMVTSGGAPVTGVDATLQFQKAKTKAWTTLGSAPIAADGSVGFAPVVTAPGAWRISVPAAAGRAEQVSSAVTVKVAGLVKANPKKKVLKAQARTTVRVVSHPAKAGQAILVQVRQAGKWKTVGRGKASAAGIVKISITAQKRSGVYTYQAIAQPQPGYNIGISPEFTIRVK
jgi:spore germination protein YaaH